MFSNEEVPKTPENQVRKNSTLSIKGNLSDFDVSCIFDIMLIFEIVCCQLIALNLDQFFCKTAKVLSLQII